MTKQIVWYAVLSVVLATVLVAGFYFADMQWVLQFIAEISTPIWCVV